MREINAIIVHCSATKAGEDIQASDIDRLHKQMGFAKIGYHYVVCLDGTVERGLYDWEPGTHCENENPNSIGICYIGGLSRKGEKPTDTRTARQKRALRILIAKLLYKYPSATVHGHNEYANQACPCFNVKEERYSVYDWING